MKIYIAIVSPLSRPLETQSVYPGPASLFRWCPQSEGVFATVGLGREVKVHHIGHQKVCRDFLLWQSG